MNKTAIITGGSGGIGEGIAKDLDRLGYNLIINYNNNESKAFELASELKSAIPFKADIRDFSQVEAMMKTAFESFGAIDLLINNSGIAKTSIFQDFTLEDYHNIFDINVLGVMNTSKAVIPYMLKNHTGNIINISSIWGICGASCEVIYSASKAAVIGFTKALAKELGPSGIRVNAVAPGAIKTKMLDNLTEKDFALIKEETPLGIIGTPEDVAKSVAFLASEDAKFITGQVISPNGGFVI